MYRKTQKIRFGHIAKEIEDDYIGVFDCVGKMVASMLALTIIGRNDTPTNIRFENPIFEEVFQDFYKNAASGYLGLRDLMSRFTEFELWLSESVSLYIDELYERCINPEFYNVINLTFDNRYWLVFDVKQMVKRSNRVPKKEMVSGYEKVNLGQNPSRSLGW